jgi:hypothetical protein
MVSVMPIDDAILLLQRSIDRLVRRLRLGPAPSPGRRRLLIVQIDGLSRKVLERSLTEGRMPFLRRLLRQHGYRLQPMSVGMPTSTPAFQMAAMYGVRPDIPGFHYHDKVRGADVYFPRAGDAAEVEARQAAGRVGILHEGSAYGCVFTGGAASHLFNFASLKQPTGASLLSTMSAFVVLAWVLTKGVALTTRELARATLRFLADPVAEGQRGFKRLLIKVGVSVWMRELFTLAVARDLYRGVPAVYVNYLDYDIFAHAYGPEHPLARRALTRVDRSLRVLNRVLRRVPEYRYDFHVLSDHGQILTTPFYRLNGGRSLEQVIFEQVFTRASIREVSPYRAGGRRLAAGIKAFRSHRAPGLFQRFVNYLERDFPWVLGEPREEREREGVRIIAAGPNAFIYFVDTARPLSMAEIDARHPHLLEELSRRGDVGFALARSADGPVCGWGGKRFLLTEDEPGPFRERPDRSLVLEGIRDLLAMPSAGDIVIYGNDAPEGNVSFVHEVGAHAGPSPEELHAFIVAPAGALLPSPITHPIQLYPYFRRYGEVDGTAA